MARREEGCGVNSSGNRAHNNMKRNNSSSGAAVQEDQQAGGDTSSRQQQSKRCCFVNHHHHHHHGSAADKKKQQQPRIRLFAFTGEDSLVRIMEYLDRQTILGVLSISPRKSLLHLRFCPVHGSKLIEKANNLPWSCEDCEEYKKRRKVRCPSCDKFDDFDNVRECLGECNQTGCSKETCPSRLTHCCPGCNDDDEDDGMNSYCSKCSEKLLKQCCAAPAYLGGCGTFFCEDHATTCFSCDKTYCSTECRKRTCGSSGNCEQQ